jgi:hypothetical protein
VEASIEYANPNDTFVPRIQLLFSPFGLPFVPIEILGTDVNKIISNFSYFKDRDNPSGIFTFELTPDPELIKSIVDVINRYSGNSYSQIWGQLGVDLEDLFKPMSLCQLWVNGYHKMTGTVRSCHRRSTVQDRNKLVSYSIAIDELSNLYNKNTLSLDTITADQMQTNMVDSFTKSIEMLATTNGVPLSTALLTIINAFVSTTLTGPYPFSCSDGMPLSFRLMATPNPVGGIANLSFAMNMFTNVNMFMMHSQGGGLQSCWSFLKNLIPNPWMEFYTESGGRTMVTEPLGAPSIIFPGFNYIVARSVPYSNPLIGIVNPIHFATTFLYDLNALSLILGGDFVIITDDMIIEKELGFDCTNQFTLFHTRYESKAVGGGAMDLTDKGITAKGPMNPMASGGIKTFGKNEMFESIDPVNLLMMGPAAGSMGRIGKTKMGIPSQIMSKPALSNLLATWFRNQSRFREGTITCRGIPYARPGMYCLYLPSLTGKKPENLRDIGMYYINSLSETYNLENDAVDYRTTLSLIRGVPMPTTVAQTALLLFDYEILPPDAGLYDGEVMADSTAKTAAAGL